MGKATLTGRKKYTNGLISKFCIPGTEPKGFYLGCTDTYRKIKATKQLELWRDPSYREALTKTRQSSEYRMKLVEIVKKAWSGDYELHCLAIKEGANRRFNDEAEHEKCSVNMINLWLNENYREKQVLKLKEGHKDIYQIHPEYIEKISDGNKLAWLVDKDSILQKQFETKSKNKSWNTSKTEEIYYNTLLELYTPNDILRQYRDSRYPFYCDFYIKSEDLFIEIQGSWVHGGRPYDPNDEECQKQLAAWQEKAVASVYYLNAIKVWTITDVKKKLVAIENKLNIKFIY